MAAAPFDARRFHRTAGRRPFPGRAVPAEGYPADPDQREFTVPRIRAASIAEHKAQTRREIINAAAGLFQQQGYSETSLGDIAAFVGIGRTTLYEYFTDKEDILATMVEESLPQVIEGIVEDSRVAGGSRARLEELIRRGLRYVSADDHLGSLVMHELPRLTGPAAGRVAAAHRRLGEEIMRVVREGIGSGEFRDLDPVATGRIVTSLLMTASQSLIRARDAREQRDALESTLVRFVFEGLGA
jgi:AcrR family transcriptional regulator